MVRKIQLIVNMYVVLKIRYIFYSKVICMAQWLSWLERRPVTAEVVSSSLIWVVYGVLAQLGEHLPYKQRVIGSSPIGPICRSGGTGRRPGLKIPWVVIPVPVRFRSAARFKRLQILCFREFGVFFIQHLHKL